MLIRYFYGHVVYARAQVLTKILLSLKKETNYTEEQY